LKDKTRAIEDKAEKQASQIGTLQEDVEKLKTVTVTNSDNISSIQKDALRSD
jgi:hypothetical protein